MSAEIDESENLLPDLVREILAATKRSLEVSIPCIVTEVISRTKVNVRPLIKIVTKDGASIDRAVIEGLPVFTAGAGDKFISFPVVVGDIGWLDACDRDISLFLQSYENAEPPTNRMHSFSDARFTPDIMTNITVAEEDATAMVIQTRDGTVKIAVDNDEIRIKNNDASVIMGADSIDVATSSVTINITADAVTGVAPGGFDLNGFTIDASGAAVSPVSVTAPTVAGVTSLTAAGKEMAGHTHAGSATAPTGPIAPTGANN
tara:strand:- start:2675 stop:3457 length:783 start_codon:yes stop_codon:yes gene_type:complete